MNKPNILWILAEDIGCHQGCFGDPNAITPNIDAFSKEAIRFDCASSCGPVCSAARSTLIMGMLSSSFGASDHRSMMNKPDELKIFPYYLKKAGYYTGIGKTDFNFPISLEEEFDENIKSKLGEDTAEFAKRIQAAYKNRKENQPFFMMPTILCTHQSQYGFTNTADIHRQTMPRLKQSEYQDRDKIKVPDYHFNTPSTREIWAQYHEKMTTMDRMFGEIIDKLKEDDLYEDTIIFFFGDNGHGIPSGKCSLWRDGVHVPLIVRVPDKYKKSLHDKVFTDSYGEITHKHVSFIDFAPTIFDLAGIEPPLPHFQGKSFYDETSLGKGIMSFGDRVGENPEGFRSYAKGDYLYIKNFSLTSNYSLNSYSVLTSSWMSAENAKEGMQYRDTINNRKLWFCEPKREAESLFNIKEDKFQLVNLASNKEYSAVLEDMRKDLYDEILRVKDRVLMPEMLMYELVLSTGKTGREIIDSEFYPLKKLVELEKRYEENLLKAEDYKQLLGDKSACIRLWAIRKCAERLSEEFLSDSLKDESDSVKFYSACILIKKQECVSLAEKAIKEIILSTQNAPLLMLLVDILKEFPTVQKEIYEVLVNRLDSKTLKGDERYLSCLRDSVCLIGKRINASIKLTSYNRSWSDEIDEQIDRYLMVL